MRLGSISLAGEQYPEHSQSNPNLDSDDCHEKENKSLHDHERRPSGHVLEFLSRLPETRVHKPGDEVSVNDDVEQS